VALFDKIKKQLDNDRPLTAEQEAFLAAVREAGPGEAFGLEAKAGTGKTYTIVRAAEELQGRVLMLAFNAKIRKELQARAPRGCTVHTFHSYCNSILFAQRKYEIKPGTAKTYAAMKHPDSGVKNFRARWPIAQGVSLAKNLAFGLLLDNERSNWESIYREYDIRIPRGVTEDYVIENAMRLFRETTRSKSKIDYDDMLYYVARDGTNGDQWDYVIVDESQDTNLTQLRVLDHLMENGNTRLLFVGDPQQAIYGWRGAGVDAFDVMADRYKAKVFDLTTTWRCPKTVVREAQRIVPKIQYAEAAEEGEVIVTKPNDFCVTRVSPGDVVLCRNNAPLLQGALLCLQSGVPCAMLGRDVSKVIINQTNVAFRDCSVRDQGAFARLQRQYNAELSDRPFALAQALEEVEMAQTVYSFMVNNEIPFDSVERLLENIEAICNRLLSDELRGDRVIFSTIHRSKGLEWPTVYLIQPEKMPSKAARKVGGWHLAQERNLAYVAITRAKNRLVYVSNITDPLASILELSAGADGEEDVGDQAV
jgi:DNA helicase-2/ATP-dependent DNA helicase PcrA